MKNKNETIRPVFNWIWLFIISVALSALSFVLIVSAYDFSRIVGGKGVYSITTYDDTILIPMMIMAILCGIGAFFTFLHFIKSFKVEANVRSLEIFHGKKREII